jgi:hypothetical protein
MNQEKTQIGCAENGLGMDNKRCIYAFFAYIIEGTPPDRRKQIQYTDMILRGAA